MSIKKGRLLSRVRCVHHRILSITQELHLVSSDDRVSPRISNMVCTTVFLPQKGYEIPLKRLSVVFKGASQFCPDDFAAHILTTSDEKNDCPALIFRSGKMVVVGGSSKNHILYLSQKFRYLIERVKFKTPQGFITFEGRTIFDCGMLNNIVGHGDLGVRINLAKLALAAPHRCKYIPDQFPGLKYKTWVNPQRQCQCEARNDEKIKCCCRLRVLLFESGKAVITGSRDVANVYRVFDSLKQLKATFKTDNANKYVPKEDRFLHRISEMMIMLENLKRDDDVILMKKKDTLHSRVEPNAQGAIAFVQKTKPKKRKTTEVSAVKVESRIVQMALQKDANTLRLMLHVEPNAHNQARAAMQTLEAQDKKDALDYQPIVSLLADFLSGM